MQLEKIWTFTLSFKWLIEKAKTITARMKEMIENDNKIYIKFTTYDSFGFFRPSIIIIIIKVNEQRNKIVVST